MIHFEAHVRSTFKRKKRRMDKSQVILKVVDRMRIQGDHLYLAYHKKHDENIWRVGTPCLHSMGTECPLG